MYRIYTPCNFSPLSEISGSIELLENSLTYEGVRWRKIVECIRIFFIHFREISKCWTKVIHFRRILWLISWSLQGGITCMAYFFSCKTGFFTQKQFQNLNPSY